MNYNIHINQRAVAELNRELARPLDLKDVTILDWLLKFHAEPKAKKLILNESVYFWGAYQLIIDENPLLQIESKRRLADRIEKIEAAGLIQKHIEETKGNRTYFSITQRCFDLFKRDSGGVCTPEYTPMYSKGQRVCTPEYNNNNIIDNIYTTIKGKIEKNTYLVETVCMQNRIGKDTVTAKISEFARFCQSTTHSHDNDNDLFKHFTYWMTTNARKPVVGNLAPKLNWFMQMFNTISRKEFIPTLNIERLFAERLAEGFTGAQMETAVKNMYSVSDKNDWHKRTGYVNATPEFLLKNENLNKYLNQKY